MSCQITPLVINSLGGGDTHTRTHTHTTHTHTHTHTHAHTHTQTDDPHRMRPACAWFKNYCTVAFVIFGKPCISLLILLSSDSVFYNHIDLLKFCNLHAVAETCMYLLLQYCFKYLIIFKHLLYIIVRLQNTEIHSNDTQTCWVVADE